MSTRTRRRYNVYQLLFSYAARITRGTTTVVGRVGDPPSGLVKKITLKNKTHLIRQRSYTGFGYGRQTLYNPDRFLILIFFSFHFYPTELIIRMIILYYLRACSRDRGELNLVVDYNFRFRGKRRMYW